jgi:hypothetical protein
MTAQKHHSRPAVNEQRGAPVGAHLPSPFLDGSSETLLTERDVAVMLQATPRALQAWRTRGGGPPFFKFGRLVRYDRASVSTWLTAQLRRSTSE